MEKETELLPESKDGDDSPKTRTYDEWLSEISRAEKRLESYWKEAKSTVETYSEPDYYNILYSNIDTQLPVLFSQAPRPSIKPRLEATKGVELAASDALMNMGEQLIDGQSDYYNAIEHSVFDSLLVGRGIVRVTIEEDEIHCESVKYNKFIYGYADCWDDVPWIAFIDDIDKDEAKRLFGEEVAELILYDEKHKLAKIYQLWDKDGGRKIKYISPSYPGKFLLELDDTLKISTFYPVPRPIEYVYNTHTLKPVIPYSLYKKAAEQLTTISERIASITKAIKAVGIYDASLGDDISEMLRGEDGFLHPSDKSAGISLQGGIESAIWMMPIDKLVAVVGQLYASRDACKQEIYEIMGLSDIMRGATAAQETATAQNIKSRWGSLRLKRAQNDVQRLARDLLQIMLEVAGTQYDEQKWADITGIDLLLERQVEPLMHSALAGDEKAALMLKGMPTWKDALALINDDLESKYKISIETNSTVLADQQEDQENMGAVLAAITGYMQSVAPLVTDGVLPIKAAKDILGKIMAGYQAGNDLAQYIDEIALPEKQQGEQQQPDPNASLIEVEKIKQASQSAIADKRIASDERIAAAKLAMEERLERERMAADQQLEQLKSQLKIQEEMLNNANVQLPM